MLLLNRLKAACALGISLAIFGLTTSALAGQAKDVKALVQIIDQKYCYGDSEIFAVSMLLEVTAINSSSKSIYFRSDMDVVYWKMASSLKEACNGKFFQTISPTSYPGPNQKTGRKIRVKPGRSVVLRLWHSVFGRHDVTPEIPGSVPPGAYVLQVLLRPRMSPPEKERKRALREELKSITPEPFLFQVPKEPTITSCK